MPLTGVALRETQADVDDAGVYLFCMATQRKVTSSISPISYVQKKSIKKDSKTLRFQYHGCICVKINSFKIKELIHQK